MKGKPHGKVQLDDLMVLSGSRGVNAPRLQNTHQKAQGWVLWHRPGRYLSHSLNHAASQKAWRSHRSKSTSSGPPRQNHSASTSRTRSSSTEATSNLLSAPARRPPLRRRPIAAAPGTACAPRAPQQLSPAALTRARLLLRPCLQAAPLQNRRAAYCPAVASTRRAGVCHWLAQRNGYSHTQRTQQNVNCNFDSDSDCTVF